jgi:hypothetical protein
MAIRRPSVYNQNQFVFQDFFYADDEISELRYIVAKYDGEVFHEVGETFDYPTPDLKGGSIVARVDYTVEGNLVTIDHWEVNWRDEWPLRLAFQFLANCLYSRWQGFTIRVNKDAYPFWVSEWFRPISNDPNDYLIKLE